MRIVVFGLEIEARHLFGRSPGDRSPYMSQLIIGRLRFHLFHRGDEDPDPHDHPWSFTTFPLRSYAEEVTDPATNAKRVEVVTAFHLHHRLASYTHRVLYPVRPLSWEDIFHGVHLLRISPVIAGRWMRDTGPIFTIVWTGKKTRPWGFLKTKDGKWCWVAWREYVFGGGKDSPCQ